MMTKTNNARKTVEAQVEETVMTEETKTEAPQRGLPKVIAQPTAEQLAELAKMTSKSAKIRALAGWGYSTNENMYSGIANFLGLRPQHVRNVLNQPLKKA